MFERLGRKIDYVIVDIAEFNRKIPWYKFYSYYILKRRCKKEHIPRLISMAYDYGVLYKWQYERLMGILYTEEVK